MHGADKFRDTTKTAEKRPQTTLQRGPNQNWRRTHQHNRHTDKEPANVTKEKPRLLDQNGVGVGIRLLSEQTGNILYLQALERLEDMKGYPIPESSRKPQTATFDQREVLTRTKAIPLANTIQLQPHSKDPPQCLERPAVQHGPPDHTLQQQGYPTNYQQQAHSLTLE